MSAGAYLRQCREAKGLTLFDLALRTETVPPVAAERRAEWIGLIEDGTAPLSAASALRLSSLLDADLEQLLVLSEQEGRAPRAGALELRLAASAPAAPSRTSPPTGTSA